MDWSLSRLLNDLHNKVERELESARGLGHSVAKGDASEEVWIELFNTYLPMRYQAARAFVVDSRGNFSDQMDIVIYDRQYSPLIFEHKNQTIIAAESVYAVFEAKQSIDAEEVVYAQKKAQSVRRLHRTSLPIPHAGGTYPPKPLPHIFGGILAFESEWKPGLGTALIKALASGRGDAQLDIGCVAAHGYFLFNSKTGNYDLDLDGKHATAFLFKLITLLQYSATVPMIDIQAYAQWLGK